MYIYNTIFFYVQKSKEIERQEDAFSPVSFGSGCFPLHFSFFYALIISAYISVLIPRVCVCMYIVYEETWEKERKTEMCVSVTIYELVIPASLAVSCASATRVFCPFRFLQKNSTCMVSVWLQWWLIYEMTVLLINFFSLLLFHIDYIDGSDYDI